MQKVQSSIKNVIKNIELSRSNVNNNDSAGIVAVVSGNTRDQKYWQERLDETKSRLFHADGKTQIISLEERIGNKTKEGNFLGTLLAYSKIEDIVRKAVFDYRDSVILLGMLFGRGERMSPFTQIKGNRKPAITVASARIRPQERESLTAIEEALHFFAPVTQFLKVRGFRGILCKWGDETQVASIDLSSGAGKENAFENYDVIKFVSVLKVTDELASQKDWVAFDEKDNMVAQLARDNITGLKEKFKGYGIKPDSTGDFYAGISLGPVAVSFDVLDIARDVFKDEIVREGVTLDFDPYLLMALSMKDDATLWQKHVSADAGLQKLEGSIPSFFEKVQSIKKKFERNQGRPLNIKILDLGGDLLWSDIGQHKAMFAKHMRLLGDGSEGEIARRVEDIPDEKDDKGNILIDSFVSPEVDVRNSVIIHSVLLGKGCVESTVIKNCILGDVSAKRAFAVDSVLADADFKDNSGAYELISDDKYVLDRGLRAGTLLTEDAVYQMEVNEGTDLRDKQRNYNTPVLNNSISFKEAFEAMEAVDAHVLVSLRQSHAEHTLKRCWDMAEQYVRGSLSKEDMETICRIFTKQSGPQLRERIARSLANA